MYWKDRELDDQTILASEDSVGNVTVCPGGVVHVNMPHCSLKFLPSDFVKFSELIAKARTRFDAPVRGDGKPRLTVVSNESEHESVPDPHE